MKAAASGDTSKCDQLLQIPGANVNAIFAGHTALQAAAQNGHINIIKRLMRFNCDLEIEVEIFWY